MKQRFSSLDVKVIAHELSNSLVTLRLANVYDLSTKIFLLKFAKPDDKKQMIIDSGFRCHLTSFSRVTAAAPTIFVTRLRRYLKTRRVTSVSQVGTDRIVEFQFSDGQYRLFLEFYAGGNIILTDKELNILALLRIVPEGEGQEELRLGRKYSLESRQNYGGIPVLTKERLRGALQKAANKAEDGPVVGKKQKKNSADALRKAIAVSLTEFPPLLVDHSMRVTGFDGGLKPAEVLGNDALMEALIGALDEAKRIVAEITSSHITKGYIIAKQDRLGASNNNSVTNSERSARESLKYDDFHPFRPRQFEEDPSCTILEFDGFNKTVDEFFSSIEGQILESRLHEREVAAKKKLEAARQDQANRLGGLLEVQELNERKAGAIEANIERVQETMDAINSLIASGKDWDEISKLIDFEQKRHNPVAEIIKLPLQLERNTVTLLLSEGEDMLKEEDERYETDSDVSGSEDEGPKAQSAKLKADSKLAIDINLGISSWSNATEYYEQKRTAAVKEVKTAQALSKALKSQEQKITQDLKKGLKQEKAVLRPVRQQMWFEKFIWFVSSDGYLVLGGRDAQQNEILYKKLLRKGDVYVHADLLGAANVIIRNKMSPDTPMPPSTLSQAGTVAVSSSSAWESKAGMSAWWVNADQVSKSTPSGEFLPVGSFAIRGKKNFLPPAQLVLGFGVMFRISEESKARRVKHRLHSNTISGNESQKDGDLVAEIASKLEGRDDGTDEGGDDDELDNGEHDRDEDMQSSQIHVNPLQSAEYDLQYGNEANLDLELQPVGAEVAEAENADTPPNNPVQGPQAKESPAIEQDGISFTADNGSEASENDAKDISKLDRKPTRKATAPLPRGKRSKARKIATKYKDQDEEDRIAAQTLIGATLGREKAEAEVKAKAEREAESTFQKERRRAQHQRNIQETAEHEELRKLMLDEGIETPDDERAEEMNSFDALIGTPLPGDEILDAIPVCAPWAAMAKHKYKAKLQPGAQKKGRAVKEILDRWVAASAGKGVVDPESRDVERIWPREIELLKTWKPEECINCVPVGKVKVMMAGGLSSAAAKGAPGKGRGGKGSKKQR